MQFYKINATADTDAAKIAVGLQLLRENRDQLSSDKALDLAGEFVEKSKPTLILREGKRTARYEPFEELCARCGMR